jgi:hypothetical protein
MRVVLKKLGLKRASSNEASNDRALLQEGKETLRTVGASLPDAPDESLKVRILNEVLAAKTKFKHE